MPLSASDLLAKMTAAVMSDSSLQDAIRNYDEDSLDSYIEWLREDGLDVIIHGKTGALFSFFQSQQQSLYKV